MISENIRLAVIVGLACLATGLLLGARAGLVAGAHYCGSGGF